jgi:TolB-like protein
MGATYHNLRTAWLQAHLPKKGQIGYRLYMSDKKRHSLRSARRSLALPVVLLTGLWLGFLQPRPELGEFLPAGLALAGPKTQTVAVLPFRDLSAGTRFVGEAIRETVTSDLKQLGSLRVIERGNLDKVLAEQGLQATQQDMDTSTVVKLGKVLGASLILIGAYQKLPPQVRLTARFVKVETSEIIGTAKIDGNTKDFLRLQDRITAALLRSAGFGVHAKQVLQGAEHRPDLANLRTLELYGQAVTAPDDVTRRQYLTMAVATDQNFSYAVKDLSELESRLKEYEAKAQDIQAKELADLQEQAKSVTDQAAIAALISRKIDLLVRMRRYHTAAREARAFLDELPAGAPISFNIDSIANGMLTADQLLKDGDALLRDGERYLQRAPASQNFANFKARMQGVIDAKRHTESEAAAVLATLSRTPESDTRWDLCWVAQMYSRHGQYEAMVRLFDACFKFGTHPRSEYLSTLVTAAWVAGDWSRLRRLLAEWQQADAPAATKWQHTNDQALPTDE